MTKTDAVMTLCKEFQRTPTRRSYVAISKALVVLGLDWHDRAELEQRLGFRDLHGDLYAEFEKQPRKPKATKLDWSNVR